MQHMCVSVTLNVDGEPDGDLESRANAAVDCICTAVVEEKFGQAEIAHLCKSGGSVGLERVFGAYVSIAELRRQNEFWQGNRTRFSTRGHECLVHTVIDIFVGPTRRSIRERGVNSVGMR